MGWLLCSGEGEAEGMFIPGMFVCVCGDAAGVGEGTGWSMPGIFIAGAGGGDAFGVGEGIVIGCCADAESVPARNTNMSDKRYAIGELLIWSAAASTRGPQRGIRAGVVVARRRFGSVDRKNKSKAPPLSAHSKFAARDIRKRFLAA
jgi:hypothetical protein